MTILRGDLVWISGTLKKDMQRLGFDSYISKALHKIYADTIVTALDVWTDEETKTEYVTVKLGTEIPLSCCTKVNYFESKVIGD